MATNDTGKKITRKRGRPSAKQEVSSQASTYNGPSADEVFYAMSDLEVTQAFNELGEEPRPALPWFEGEPCVLDQNYVKPASALELNKACNRDHLLTLYLARWIESLDDTDLIQEYEQSSANKLSESEKRYLKRSDLRERLAHLVWPEIVSKSKLYQSPTN